MFLYILHVAVMMRKKLVFLEYFFLMTVVIYTAYLNIDR